MPVHNDVVGKVFPKLDESRSAHLYMAMYARARQTRSKQFAMSLRELGELIGCDWRTARNCIIELVRKGFVKMNYEGMPLRSRTHKTEFRIPLSEIALTSGRWFPIPRFLVTRYFQAYPGSLLLIIVVFFQHQKWKNQCWLSMQFLERTTNWSRRKIYAALNRMGHKHRWEKLGTELPWPLEISYPENRESRRFSVRAVHYYRLPDRPKRLVGLSKEFASYFGYREATPGTEEETEN